jgi:hypothetical protein
MRLSARVCSLRSLLAVTLCTSVTMTATLGAQDTRAVQLPPQKLTVLVLQGQGAVNFIPDQRATTPVVEVRDQNALPVEGAEVNFTLPASGPGGLFSTGQRTAKLRTNADGQAAAPFTVNGEVGTFQIQVAATFGDRAGSAVISQSNSLRAAEKAAKAVARPWYRSWKFWAVVGGAGAAVAIVLATTVGGSSAPTVTITPGSPTVGHP